MYWCGTIHAIENEKGLYSDRWPDKLEEYKTQRGTLKVTFTAGQEERGGQCGRYHKHVYVEFEKKVKFDTLKNAFDREIHWEARGGTAEEAWHYAQKGMDCKEWPPSPGELRYVESRWTLGKISNTKPGKRTDLDSVREMIASGATRRDIATEQFGTYVRYHRGIEAAAQAMGVRLDQPVLPWIERTNYILYGTTGTGKSLMAEKIMGTDSFYIPEQNAQGALSFEEYRGEKWIFIDDFEPKTLTPGMLKRMLDNRPVTLPGRGVSRQAQHIGVIITTNHNPMTWVEGANQDMEWNCISRRCRYVWHAKETEWITMGGKDPKEHGKRDISPLPELLEWAAERQRAAEAAMEQDGAGPDPNQSVEYSDLPQASQVIDLSQED